MNYIELFAGCGGLSLGLKASGFDNIMANEISPMAAETYAYNFKNEDLSDQSFVNSGAINTVWLASRYPLENMALRLREDQSMMPSYDDAGIHSDLQPSSSLKGKLVVGSIKELNRFLIENPTVLNTIKNPTLVSGGPPCQSFSLAGLRQLDNNRNTLPLDFINFVQMTQPKIALLENVSGILKPFKKNDVAYHAWFEIAKGFREIGYAPLCLYVNSYLSGVPQLRKRFILIALSHEMAKSLIPEMNDFEKSLLQPSLDFMHESIETECLSSRLTVHDLTTDKSNGYSDSFLGSMLSSEPSRFSVKDAIDDLSNKSTTNQSYRDFLHQKLGTAKSQPVIDDVANNENRTNKPLIKRRFRIYQILSVIPPTAKNEVMNLLRGKADSIPLSTLELLLQYEFLSINGLLERFSDTEALDSYLRGHLTKKNSQKALIASQPSPSALSIPDDFCHYSESQLRTLTVREMARIQSFPDDFVFRSKVTTGGTNRRFEVPQYTQVGNAIPPLLGYQLGNTLKKLLSLAGNE